jgi:hypothetical protein
MSFIVSAAAPVITAPVISAGSPTSSSCVVSLVTPSASSGGITYYVLYVYNGATLIGTFQVPLASFPYTVSGLPASTVISIYATGVLVTSSAFASPVSSTVTVTTSASGSVPAQVTWNAVPAAVSSSQINMSWNAASGATSYTLQRNGVTIASNLTSLTYNDTGLAASTTYIYEVAGVNSSGTGPYSVSQSATTQPSSGVNSLLALFQNAIGSQYFLGQHANQDGGPGGLFSECLASGGGTTLPSSGVTGANATILNDTSGTKTNSNTFPALMATYINSGGTGGTSVPLSDCISACQQHQARGGIVHLTWELYSPANGTLTGNGTEFGASGVTVPGSAMYNLVMYGSGGPSAPNGGVWALAQALLSISKSFPLRVLHEGNLSRSSFWWGAGGGGGPPAAQWQTYFKQIISYIRTIMGANASKMVVMYNVNSQSGMYSALDPGSSFRDMFTFDRYGDTTSAAFISNISSTQSYGAGLGLPMLVSECGVETYTSVSQYTYDGSIFDSRTQSSYPNIVGQLTFYQNWAYSYQFNYSAANGTRIGAVPVYT